ncbi:MAG: flagellar protein FlgJ [Halothiobacillaceae bacterium]|nr:MAG: flagellar protein FlgJ [Halothiobacillaceae bacterium]
MVNGYNSAGLYTEFSGLTELKAGAHKKSPEAIQGAARQFESLFIQMMLKSMREATLGDGLMDNDQSKLYMEMFDKQISLEMSKGRGIGLSGVIAKQLGGGELAPNPLSHGDLLNPHALTIRKILGSVESARPVTPVTSEAKALSADTPEMFIQSLWPYAQRAGAALGVDPKAIIAQAALETGWGSAMIQNEDGQNSFNFFGIKAGTQWQGKRVNSITTEYIAGTPIKKINAIMRRDGFSQVVAEVKSPPIYAVTEVEVF